MSYNFNSQVFPGTNCIYVDNDAPALRSKGLLAYSTLGDALNAWDVGGEARRKFGTPTANNRATIILGAGNINSGQTEAGGSCYLNYDFVSIIGQGREVTTLVNNIATSDAIVIIYTSATANLSHFTIKPSASAVTCLKTVNNWSGVVSNLKLTGNPSGGFWTWTGTFLYNAIIEDCIFDFSAQSGISVPFSLNANDAGTIRNCSFFTSSTCPSAFQWSSNASFVLKGCTFIGTATSAMIKCTTTGGMSTPRIVDCHIEVSTGFGILLSTGNADPDILIQNCYIFAYTESCLSLTANKKTRIIGCTLETQGSNKDAIVLNTGTTGCTIFGCRIVGSGNGRAINSSLTIGVEVSNCTMRKQQRAISVPGESIGDTLQNNIWMPNNSEIEAFTGDSSTINFPMGGLVSWWKLNEDKSNSIRRDSFGTNHMAPFRNPTITAGLANVNAAYFDATIVQQLKRFDHNSPSLAMGNFDWTWCVWAKFTLGTTNAIIYKNADGFTTWDFGFYYYQVDNLAYMDVGKNDGTRLADVGSAGLVSDAWNFIVGWHDSVADTVNIQVNNGTPVSDTTGGGAPCSLNNPLYFGGTSLSVGSPTHRYEGGIADVSFYKRVLTSAERSFLYNGGNGRTIPL